MQYIANGPDVPDALVQAHEEGRVIFFAVREYLIPPGCLILKTLYVLYTKNVKMQKVIWKILHIGAANTIGSLNYWNNVAQEIDSP